MTRTYWRCRNQACGNRHGAILGTLTAGGDLVLDPSVAAFRVHLDTRRVLVVCPLCGTVRDFTRGSVFSGRAGDPAG